LETRDTADLEVCATGVAASPRCAFALKIGFASFVLFGGQELFIRVHPRIAAWPDVKGLNPHVASLPRGFTPCPSVVQIVCAFCAF
jgi:hypothetical protein